MKRKILSLAVVAASAVLISCEKDEIVENYDIVRFTSGITATPTTRVAIDSEGNSVWEKDDPIGIFMLKHETNDVSYEANNIPYKASQAGKTTTFNSAASAIYYPLDESEKFNFIAYHPYSTTVSDFVYKVDVSNQASQTAIDLMWAKADNNKQGYSKADARDGKDVNLAFTHKLVKFVMNVTKDASVPGKITSVRIEGMNTTATFDLRKADGLTGMGNVKAITPYAVEAKKKYEAILLPVGTLGYAHTVTFITDKDETYVWRMNKDIAKLETGKMYTYNINVTRYTVTANGSINNWVVEKAENGTAN